MKKLLVVCLLLLVTLCSAWTKDKEEIKLLKEYTEIPVELRGTWYTLHYSTDEGKTDDTTYRPLLIATTVHLSSMYYSDRIIKAEKFQHPYGPAYLLYSEEQGITYLVAFYKEVPSTPFVYMYKDEVEQFRSCVKIIRI